MMITKDKFSISMDHKVVEKLDGKVQDGLFSSRSEAIESYVRQALKLEDTREGTARLFIECLELVAEHPEAIEKFKEFWQKE